MRAVRGFGSEVGFWEQGWAGEADTFFPAAAPRAWRELGETRCHAWLPGAEKKMDALRLRLRLPGAVLEAEGVVPVRLTAFLRPGACRDPKKRLTPCADNPLPRGWSGPPAAPSPFLPSAES